MSMRIRKAALEDFDELYRIGKNTAELKVSATEKFMDADEFQWCIKNPDGVFLLAEVKGRIAGFICANTKDKEILKNKYACLVYLTVLPQFQGRGVGKKLYAECEKKLKAMGMTHVYSWANVEGGKIMEFMRKQGFREGHRYAWMDKKL